MENITFAKRLKEARKNARLTQQQLADIVGRTKSAVSRWESGENTPQLFDLVKIENAVGVPGKYLMYGTEEIKPTTLAEISQVSSKLSEHRQENVLNFAKKQLDKQQATINETAIYQLPNIKKFDDSDFINVPVLGNIAAGAPIYAEENFDGYRPVSDKYGDIGDIFWLQARGNSMVSLIYNQDYVLIEKTPFVENGEIAAVLFTDENSATLKRVYKEKNQLRLVAENEEYDDIIANGNNPAIILGRAIKVERDI